MLIAANPGERANWRVMWVAKGRIISKDFGADISGAIKLYAKAVSAGKRAATLNCRNMGMPPPPDLQPHVVTVRVRNPNGKVVREQRLRSPLKKLNRQGIWWCPYCMELRKFKKQRGFNSSLGWVGEPGYHCPLCQISHRDGAVRKWNPIAMRIVNTPMRGSKKDPAKRRRRRANSE